MQTESVLWTTDDWKLQLAGVTPSTPHAKLINEPIVFQEVETSPLNASLIRLIYQSVHFLPKGLEKVLQILPCQPQWKPVGVGPQGKRALGENRVQVVLFSSPHTCASHYSTVKNITFGSTKSRLFSSGLSSHSCSLVHVFPKGFCM